MPFTITAELPLGTYRGASVDGSPERIPSVSRLYSALLCAAGFGPRAVEGQADGLGPCSADEQALRWLEEHPPDAVSLPAIEVNVGRATAYRNDGTIKEAKGKINVKRLAKSPDVSVAVGGTFSWTWTEAPPPPVILALTALCPDVPCLGTTESPVRLRATDDKSPAATHTLDEDAGLFSGVSGEDVELPVTGRLDELRAAHREATGAPPTVAKDKRKTDEVSRSWVPPRSAVALARYRPAVAPPAAVPWPQVLVLPVQRPIPQRDRVRTAVQAHRALISLIGDGAPALLSGVYPEDVPAARPSNRLAIQVLDQQMPVDLRGAPSALALLLPHDAAAVDLDVVAGALSRYAGVRRAGRLVNPVAGEPWAVAGDRLWHERRPGKLRLWRTEPPAIPDTRGVRGRRWNFAHAALLSLGFVWKDSLPDLSGRGDERQVRLVDAMLDAGVAVVQASPLRESDVRPYVHKVNLHAVVRPYRAELWLGDLCSDRTALAIGQSRHLGGGLLVPYDVADERRSR